MCLRPCEHIRVLLMLCWAVSVQRSPNCAKTGKKKRESLNVTLLSTVTTLATCNVSARISVAHWACAEQAPSPPRAPRKRTRWTRDELGRIPAGGRCNFNHLFFSYPLLCWVPSFPQVVSVIVLTVCSLLSQRHYSIDSLAWWLPLPGGGCDETRCPWEWNRCIACVRDRVGVKLDIKALIAASAVPPRPSQVDSQNALLLAIWLSGWSYF